MHTGSHGVMWVKSLLSELKVRINDSVFIHEDNQSAIAIAKNHGYQSRAKNIDIWYHFIREQIKKSQKDQAS